MHEIRFRLKLSAEDFLAYYRGTARDVIVRGADGRSVQFPASVLRPFVTPEGVSGTFVLVYDQQTKKCVEVKRTGD